MSEHQPPSTPAATAVVPLTSVPLGTMVTLHDVRDPGSRSPLRSLGLIDSCRMRLCKIGDPCIVQVRATRIGLSRAVARCVFVVPDTADR